MKLNVQEQMGNALLGKMAMELNSQDALFAPLLELADQFSCALEMATYLAIMKLGGPKKLFLWYCNADWQSVDKVIPSEFRSSLLPCIDDLELALLLTRVWSQSGSTDQQRKQWAKHWQIDHDVLLYSVEHERDRLLADLSHKKIPAECAHPIDLLLLPKIRFLIAYHLMHLKNAYAGQDDDLAIKGGIYCGNQRSKVIRIHPDSICYGRMIDICLYFFSEQEKRRGKIEAQQVILIAPAWLRWLQEEERDLYDLARFFITEARGERKVDLSQRWDSIPRLFLDQDISVLHRRVR